MRDADAVDLAGRPAVVLTFDPDVPPPRLINAGEVLWVGWAPREEQAVPWSALRGVTLDPRLRRLRATDVVVSTLRRASPVDVLGAIRHGARRFHVYLAPGAIFQTNARGMVLLTLRRRLAMRLQRTPGIGRAVEAMLDVRLDPPWPTLRDTRRVVAGALRFRARGTAAPSPAGRLHVVHYLGGLGPGGAERQLTYVALGARAAGHDVSVLSTFPLEGDAGHHAALLRSHGVVCEALAPTWRPGEVVRALPPELQKHLESHIAWPMIAPLIEELRRRRVDVLHAWMDLGIAVGAVAALLARVPRIVLAVRSVNPSHVQHLNQPWFRTTFRALSRDRDLRFVANSHHGACDYSRWMGGRASRFEVVHNGVPVPASTPTREERLAERRVLGIPEGAFVVVGVLRLSSEKRPLDFVAALRAARARVPALRAIHMGVGPLEAETRLAARSLGEALRLVGREDRPERWLRVADALLLTSEQEGCPNVILEAQALAVPVVLTRAGGAPETVIEGETGLIADVGDVDALAAHLVTLAGDPARAQAMGAAGRRFVAERFSIEAMVDRTLALYR